MTGRIVLFGYGNPSRGDDALGPMLLERAETWLAGQPNLTVEPVADFQLQIEHVIDLQDRDLALFLDADMTCRSPFSLTRVLPDRDACFTTHELSPGAVLQVYREVMGHEPPPAYVLGVRGERFELGEPLSAEASKHLDAAWDFLQHVLLNDSHLVLEEQVS